MREISGDIILMSSDTGDTGSHVLGEVGLKLNLFLHFCFECLVELLFLLRQTLHQCQCNFTGKLVKSAIAFARAEDI